ncbi:MAG: 50S ribosome-binding GTPase [DPANN group archaeon]|nr:50S ribosome-binding GTPase [DPANN group archaeon]
MGLWNYVFGIVRETDFVIEVVDARVPYESRSERLERAVKSIGNNLVVVLNKADLVPKEFTEKTKAIISEEYPCIFISSKDRHGVVRLKNVLREVSKGEKVRVAVIGYTNTGKSSIINALRGKKSAKVAPTPGYTKYGQWVKMNENILLWDTPGVLPSGKISAIKGNINQEKTKNISIYSRELLDIIMKTKVNNLKELYNVETMNYDEIIKSIAKRRGFVLKGGELDLKRAEKAILIDWNRGKLTACVEKEDTENQNINIDDDQ